MLVEMLYKSNACSFGAMPLTQQVGWRRRTRSTSYFSTQRLCDLRLFWTCRKRKTSVKDSCQIWSFLQTIFPLSQTFQCNQTLNLIVSRPLHWKWLFCVNAKYMIVMYSFYLISYTTRMHGAESMSFFNKYDFCFCFLSYFLFAIWCTFPIEIFIGPKSDHWLCLSLTD